MIVIARAGRPNGRCERLLQIGEFRLSLRQRRGDRPDGFARPLHGPMASKYPPAKPGALGCEPLEAVGGVADAAPWV
jgi:hypothetical protein